jgi:PiT family inorganic phosphate transporter
LATVFTMIGAMLGEGVARTIGSGIITPGAGDDALLIVLAGVIAAICWNLFTWWFGWPSSSSHALIGGLAGAGAVSSVTVHWSVIASKVLVPMVIAPVIALALAWAATGMLRWVLRNSAPGRVNRRLRLAQTVSAAALALGHGLQDAQKTMGVIVLALVTGGHQVGWQVPLWVKIVAALAISAGTWAGGWRIIRTLGRRLVDVEPVEGFVAETVGSSLLYLTAYLFKAPLSTTHTVTAAVIGAGLTKGRGAVRWRIARQIAVAWLLTLPMAAAIGAGLASILALVG